MATLQLTTREDASSAGTRRLRRDGVLPMALIAKGGETKKVQADRMDTKHLFHDITGVAIFDVAIDGGSPTRVIMKDVQRDPVSRRVSHLTVMEIAEDDIVKVFIPVVVEGTPNAVAKRAATLMVPMNQIEIKARVKDLPEQILVDASKMKQNDKIVVGDLSLGEGVEFLASDQTVLASTKQLRGMAALEEGGEESPAEEGGEAAAEEASAE
ncbi:MAG: 50S ribosomal protein L25 [Armatimonadetes bacterium]|nr:50S ribosomal protein L25 [Armatimonadota bacterium]MBS1711028.1 50S ribosomal protein L25 [Armatimonadota bacterium]MBX3108700.1 50S ribosomal protein L25 [Fimbriimonadaceae bacterium]